MEATAATAVSVGKAVLDGALGYAKSKAAEEIALQLDIEGDVAFITDELEMMQSFLMAADEEQEQDKVLTTWVKQVRDLAYNVEDSLMDFGLQAELEKASPCCIPPNLCDRRRIAKEVKKLRAKVEEVSSRSVRYRLVRGTGSKASATGAEQYGIAGAALPDIEDTERQKSKLSLHQLITSDEADLRVMAVWGTSDDHARMYEIRKSFDDPEVNSKFGCRAWVRLVLPLNPKEFLESLVRQFYENSSEETGKVQEGTTVGANVLMKIQNMRQNDGIVHDFNAKVCSSNYLIVINGLSSIEEWDYIKTYFPNKKNQSRIVVSTQRIEIARLCTCKPYQVSELVRFSSDQEIYVFHKKVEPTNNTRSATSWTNNEIQEEREQLEGASLENSAGRGLNRSTTKSTIIGEGVVEREEKSKVMDLIGDPAHSHGRKVISVWGMGGIGKTTLVQSIYRNQQLGGWKRAWATASRPFNHEVLLRSLKSQLEKKNKQNPDAEDTQQDPAEASGTLRKNNVGIMMFDEVIYELSKLLEKQKCLIVIDDLSFTKEWDSINNYLEKAARIIVTTRERGVAQHCSEEQNMCDLSVLKADDALDLFKKKVFKDTPCPILPDGMEEQAKLILKKCNGLPLAISVIGGFLGKRPITAMEWRKLNHRMSAELDINPELKMIKKVLVLSYDSLPYHLKYSFLYMSIFPEDYKIQRKRIVKRWIAEGYAREMRGITALEVGHKHFDELLDRSMTLAGDGDATYSCQLHDMIREICISKAMEQNLAFMLEEGCNMSGAQGAIRHLTISSNWNRDRDVLESMLDLSHLRSLTVFGKWSSFLISEKMRFLRVLDLEDTSGLRDHHLHQIMQLFHLKYLSLRRCGGIFSLPNSLMNLRHLQTLDVKYTNILKLPTTITMVRSLQYVHAGGSPPTEVWIDDSIRALLECGHFFRQFRDIGPEEISEDVYCCRCLACILRSSLYYICMCHWRACSFLALSHLFCRPQILEDGLNRHDICNMYRNYVFDDVCGYMINSIELPRGVGQLKALRTLGVIDVSRRSGSATLKEISMLTQLQKLQVVGIDKRNNHEFWTAIAGHNQLRSLAVRRTIPRAGRRTFPLDSYLDGSSLHPPRCLETLKLMGSLVNATKWIRIHQLQNLSKLHLEDTELREEGIEALGMLNLTFLRLGFRAVLGVSHFRCSSFRSLLSLEFYSLYFTSLGFEEGAAHRLKLIRLENSEMEEISGLRYLTSLKEIRLGQQISPSFKEKVQRHVEEHQNSVTLKLT